MNAFDSASAALALIERGLPIIERLLAVARKLGPIGGSEFSYENLLLNLTLDLEDATGRRAYINRKQRVLFRTHEAGVVRSLTWGEGAQLHRYQSTGARRVGSRAEGSREVLLLALDRPAKRGRISEIRSRETLVDAFLRDQEYFEALVERPTQRLRLRIIFPKDRPPRTVYLNGGAAAGRDSVPIRMRPDGRASVSCALHRPRRDALYSLRWVW